jgi:hypothetical protein
LVFTALPILTLTALYLLFVFIKAYIIFEVHVYSTAYIVYGKKDQKMKNYENGSISYMVRVRGILLCFWTGHIYGWVNEKMDPHLTQGSLP